MFAAAGCRTCSRPDGGASQREHTAIGEVQSGDDPPPRRKKISGTRIRFAQLQFLAHGVLQARGAVAQTAIRAKFQFDSSLVVSAMRFRPVGKTPLNARHFAKRGHRRCCTPTTERARVLAPGANAYRRNAPQALEFRGNDCALENRSPSHSQRATALLLPNIASRAKEMSPW